jgi:hypothetical protein
VEFPNAGPRTLTLRNSLFEEFGKLLRQGHERALQQAPECWAPVPERLYEAAFAGGYELVYRLICAHRYAEIPALEDDIVDFTCRVLGYRPPA